MLQRLDKLLCSQGTITRTQAGRLIRAGSVCVDGQAVRRPETKVDGETAHITVQGKPLIFQRFVYYMLNKPAGILCVSRDPNRQTVVDLLPPEQMRKDIFPAGRLDRDTVGLCILTNDGDYAHRLLAPKSGICKHYHAVLDGPVQPQHVAAFAEGIVLADGTKCLPAKIEIIEDSSTPTVGITIMEGKYHQIKRMFGTVGLGVQWLKRCSIGALQLDEGLGQGQSRPMTEREIADSLQNGVYFL